MKNSENSFDEINAIVEELLPLEMERTRILQEIGSPGWEGKSVETIASMESATKNLNDAIDKKIGDIARITNNSEDTIRQCFKPHEKDSFSKWFGIPTHTSCEFLGKVAKHKSFNPDYWTECERVQARDELLSSAFAATPVSIEEAVEQIKNGCVPHIHEDSLSGFHQELLKKGLAKNYSSSNPNAVSATKNFAYITHRTGVDDSEKLKFHFWPENRSSEHVKTTQFEFICGVTDADVPIQGSPKA